MSTEQNTNDVAGGWSGLNDGLDTPRRVQLSRRKGWRMPPNTTNVSRPGKWGNPFSIAEYGREIAVKYYRRHLDLMVAIEVLDLSELRGKNLACWCKLDEVCHADVLLAMANAELRHAATGVNFNCDA